MMSSVNGTTMVLACSGIVRQPSELSGMSQSADKAPGTVKAADVIEIAKGLGIHRGGLQAMRTAAESAGDHDPAYSLDVMRALLIILDRAEAAL